MYITFSYLDAECHVGCRVLAIRILLVSLVECVI